MVLAYITSITSKEEENINMGRLSRDPIQNHL